jgi:dimethylhistidine N-methyltransferase
MQGLSATPKVLHPKYFYDKRGSQLFEAIANLEEYYPTRTEDAILKRYAGDIAERCRPGTKIIELGSGSSVKTRRIIRAFTEKFGKLHYIPIDISLSMLVHSAKALLRKYKALRITAFASEYVTALDYLAEKVSNKLIVFLGSSIGNFDEVERVDFLRRIRQDMSEGDFLLVGMDLMKERTVLEAAYDDREGVTAEFNKNILQRINKELSGHFDLKRFRHRAFLNEDEQRVEMHLQSLGSQKVAVLDRHFLFRKGETIHTENSYKFTVPQIQEIARSCGFCVLAAWYDPKRWFSVNLFAPID